jgi:hypothetical protein
MSNSPRVAAALLVAAATATVGIGLAPAAPATAATGLSTHIALEAAKKREPTNPDPVRVVLRDLEHIVQGLLPHPRRVMESY